MVLAGDAVLNEHGEQVGEYVVVENGRVSRTGSGSPPPGSVRLGGYLFPAFIDAHAHPAGLGLALSGADLRGSRSAVEVARRLAATRGPIAYGRGWDQEAFDDPGRLPDRRLLDAAVPDRPAVAVRVCGHLAVANTLALEAARPWERYPGLVDRGRGILLEDAVGYTVERLMARVDVEPLVRTALERLAGVGVGGVSAMACTAREAEALASLDERGALRVRVACYPAPGELEGAAGILSRRRLGMVGLVGVKLFADGSLGARTARLREDYHDAPGSRGVLLLDSRKLAEWARRASSMGLRLAVHAIGDEALDHVIEGFNRAGGVEGFRVEHASLVHDGQVKALAALGVYAVMQPRFRVSDWWIDKRLGPGRVRLAYRLASLPRGGVPVALSTDTPVEPPEPWETLSAAVGLCSQPACTPGESLTPREAFTAYTRTAASASGGPLAGTGTLERGAPALIAWSPSSPLEPGWRGPARLVYPPGS
ncbi:amidohydrolase [Stetteria hydrogenophila]